MDNLEKPLDSIKLMYNLGARAKAAAAKLRLVSGEERSVGLREIAKSLLTYSDQILKANAVDMKTGQEKGLSDSFMDRLYLDDGRIKSMVEAVLTIAEQDDPIGEIIDAWQRPNGLEISRVRCPIGVIGLIYESRPNVTADASALCIRSGNAVILRSGSDALESALAIETAVKSGLAASSLPTNAVQVVPNTDRDCVGEMLAGLDGRLDLLVPRGGQSLVERVMNEARVAVLGHLEGLCHTYVDASANLQKAVDIVVNAKMRRTGVCGASETLLVDVNNAEVLVPLLTDALVGVNCAVRGDDESRKFHSAITAATEEDWRTEYLAPVISLRLVDAVRGAIDHISTYGSGHTEAIICENPSIANQFLSEVDAGIVMHNASTQFADGAELGLGAEIGIATGRLHARGPVGARELTIPKFVVRGHHHIRS